MMRMFCCCFNLSCVICRKMPIKEFHLDRVLRDLEMTHEQVDCYFKFICVLCVVLPTLVKPRYFCGQLNFEMFSV